MVKQFMRWTFGENPPPAPKLPTGATIAQIQDAEFPAIAHLMVDGYRGTIDFEGQSDEEALVELQSVADDTRWLPIREAWLVARSADGAPASAIAVIRWLGMPFVSFVFTASAEKGRGYAAALIQQAAATLAAAGDTELVLFVTVGNPARSLYERIGFVEGVDPEAVPAS